MATLVKLSELFIVTYGVNLELNKLEQCHPDDSEAIRFISRTDKNNGISAYVKKSSSITPNPAGTISVAGGGSVLASFLQTKPYYSGRDLYYLTPTREMGELELLYYCSCIRKNRFRYNYGRQANRTLKDILLPSKVPGWAKQIIVPNYDNIAKVAFSRKIKLKVIEWKWFKISDLFEIERGWGARLKTSSKSGKYPFVTSTDQNNGWSGYTDNNPAHESNVISVTRNGSVGEAFFQPKPFCSTEDVHIFIPKFELNIFIGLFLTTIIRKEKYRYNYGRKWGLQRMNETKIKLPARNGAPDFEFMENYIKSLPYSGSIQLTDVVEGA